MKKTITILFLFISILTFGQVDKVEEAVKKETNYGGSFFYKLDIKKLPADSTKSVAAVIKNDVEQDESDVYSVDLVLLLIDNTSLKILAKLTEEDRYETDAIRLSNIKLDMANYSITDNIRAFGVRVVHDGSSHPNPYGDESISLYCIKGTTFQRVLYNFETYLYTGETDMKCNFQGEETNTVLAMEKTKTNGYHDIRVSCTKTILKSRNPKKKDGDCIDTNKKLKPKYKTLKFIKCQYQLKNK